MTDSQFEIIDKEIHVDLYYPRSDDSQNKVVLGLMDVRAADDLVITYDFDRDGWSITREVHKESGPDGDRLEGTGVYVEVSFIPAWTMQTGWGNDA